MRSHDRYARVTPYEVAIPGRTFAEERFPLMRKEAEERGFGLEGPAVFTMLAQVGRALRALRGDDDGARRYGIILFHAFHFWSSGEPLYLLRTGATCRLTRAGAFSKRTAPLAAPSPAGYAQFPYHLFWARPEEGGAAEPLDGFFWVATPEALHLTAVSGLRADRPGFAVMPVPGIPAGEAAGLAGEAMRPEGDDFSNTLPGGEGLYSVETHGEIVKLAVRLFRELDQGSLRAAAPVPGGQTGAPEPGRRFAPAGRIRASALPYRVVTTDGTSRMTREAE